jgi:hypothetical protein
VKLLSAALVLFAGLAAARSSDAQCVQGARNEAIRSCRLHVVTGPVLAASRVLGLAGAYQGIAEGLPGFAVNAAAPAVRTPWSWEWFDYDLDASISIPSAFRRLDDLEYDGVAEGFNYSGFVFVTLGANAQLGPWGIGVTTDLSRFDLTPDRGAGEESYRGFLSRTKLLGGRTFFDGDLVLGGGLRHIGFDLSGTTPGGETKSLVTVQGIAPEVGFLYRPAEQSFRIGATYRMAVSTGSPGREDAEKVDRWYIPQSVNMPWEIDFGVAMQGGGRPLNIQWANPRDDREHFLDDIRHARERRTIVQAAALFETPAELRDARKKELEKNEESIRALEEQEIKNFSARYARTAKARYAQLPREHILFSLGMLVVGPTSNGISLESFFTQQVTRAGAVVTYSPRAGIETELVPHVFRPRIGTYVEPSRFTLKPDWKAFRQHVTAGFDLNLFKWRVFGLYEEGTSWRVTMAVDFTHNYWNYGLSVGIWR